MSKEWYGLLNNRFEEGKNYNEDKKIHEGDDITMYHYSDRTCYYITKVVSDKNIFVKRYYICADHEKTGGMGHQDWLYFKTSKEMKEYLKKFFPDNTMSEREDESEEWVFRYGSWKRVIRRTYKDVLEQIEELKELNGQFGKMLKAEEEFLDRALKMMTTTSSNYEKLKAGKDIAEYFDLSGKISFGVRDYHYDWEF